MTHPRDRAVMPPDVNSLPEDGGAEFNRLIFSSSPYLLQHARNPVDWRPWGKEAFDEAEKRDLPIFVSIGYSTCHWCHVMERESFENPDIAEYLNAHFISVKVDREERPDIDHIHMAVCQALTGQGGWPLTVFLKPDGTPFFAGTYFPPEDRYGRPGFARLLTLLHEAWTGQRDRIDTAGQEILRTLHALQESRPGEPQPSWLHRAETSFRDSFDSEHGGFGRAPKFPMGHTLSFLLHRSVAAGNGDLAEMAVRTLRSMRRGGIFDQVGMGFCRYSTDERWLVPHFEKMLYDNALLLLAACDAFQASGDEEHAELIQEIAEYVASTMTSPEGLWFSAEDADSEGEEGKFYVFTWKEWMEVLGPDRGPVLAEYFGVRSEGNFEDGKSILHVSMDLDPWAHRHGLTREVAIKWIDEARTALRTYRAGRVRPALDDKCLASWNGLMLAALSRAARVLNDDAIGQAAIQGSEALRSTLMREDGSVRHSIRNGKVSEVGFLDDSSFLAWGFLELYQWRFHSKDLETALLLHTRMVEDFGDEALQTLFITKKDGDPLLLRPRESYDGALPSGASVAVVNAVRLAHLTGEEHWSRQAWEWITSFGQAIENAPSSHAMMLTGLDHLLNGMTEIIITAPDRKDAEPFLNALGDRFLPSAVVHVLLANDQDDLVSLLPHLQGYPVSKEGSTVYLCHDKICGPPIRSVEELQRALTELVS